MIQIKTFYESGHEQSRHVVQGNHDDLKRAWQRTIDLLGLFETAVMYWNGHEVDRYVSSDSCAR